MDRTEIDSLEIEANGHFPTHLAAQLSLHKKAELLRVIDREALLEAVVWSEVEAWQPPIYTNFTRPANTLK